MADVSKVNVNSTDYNIKDSNAMHKGVDYVTAGKKSGTTLGTQATAEGVDVTASGDYCHAEGELTTASGEGAHVEGLYNNATGRGAHAEGVSTNATNYGAHAEGEQTSVSSSGGHAEGGGTTTNGNYGHAEGYFTRAIGNSSHAQGYYTQTKARRSHAEGGYTIANAEYQHVEGKYNVEDTNGTYAHIIGGGTADDARKNIFTVDWNGNACDGTENRLLPFKAVSEAEYAALSQAEKTNGTAYFRYEANGIMRDIQDNASATDLNSGDLPTGQTIKSYLNSNLGKYFSAQSTTVVTMDAYVFYPILSLSLPAGVYIIVGSAREEGDGTGTSRRLLNINTVASFTTETPGTQTFSSFSPTHATTSLILSLNSQTTVYLNAFSDDNGAKVTHCYLRAVKLSP